MNDIRRTVLWVVFGFALVLLWDKWQVYNGHKATFFPAPAPAVVASGTGSTGGGVANSNAASTNQTPGGTAVAQQPAADTAAPGETIEVSTDVYKASFDTRGASLVRLELLKYAEQGDHSRNVLLFDRHDQHIFVAQTGLVGGADLPNHLSLFRLASSARTLADGQNDLVLQFESQAPSGVALRKTYTLHRGSYVMDLRHEVVNASAAAIKPELYQQFMRDGTAKGNTNMFAGPTSYTGFAFYTDKSKFKKADFAAIEKGKAEIEKSADDGWAAMVQHYFAAAWLDTKSAPREFFVKHISNNLYSGGMRLPLSDVAPGASTSIDTQLFVGPQEEKKLEAIAPGLELVKDYGIFTILAKPLYWLLDKIHSVVGNWGWAIVALVVLLKIAFYWLNAKAYASMAKMKKLNPRITEMRERLKDKPQQMQQEMMRIYRDEKVNPLGGCLPIVVQIPFFIALYWVLLSTVEMRNAPWILWVQDLATPDPWFILPLLMTGSTLLQTWLNPTPPDPVQARIMWIMPLVFSVMFFFFPAGLVLYWLTNNLLSIAQQWFINKRLGVLNI